MLLELDDYYPPGYEGPKSVRRIKDPVHDYSAHSSPPSPSSFLRVVPVRAKLTSRVEQ